MKNKGLCITCINDLKCSFSRVFPVLECEEFSIEKKEEIKKKIIKKISRKK